MSATYFGFPEDEVSRSLFFNFGGNDSVMKWIFLVMAAAAFGYFIYSFALKIMLWSGADASPEISFTGALRNILTKGFNLKRLNTERYTTMMHLCIIIGSVGMIFTAAITAVEGYILFPITGHHAVTGSCYLAQIFASDFSAVLFALGIIMALYRRYVVCPSKLTTGKDDLLFLLFMLSIPLTGILLDSARIELTGRADYEKLSFAGYFISPVFSMFSEQFTINFHYFGSILFLSMLLLLFVFMSSGRLGYFVTGLANIMRYDFENNKEKKYSYRQIPHREFFTGKTMGINSRYSLSSKDLADIDACFRCGLCQDRCPAWLTEKGLSPKRIMEKLQEEKLLGLDYGATISENELWCCEMCGACNEACPVYIDIMNKINGIRKYKVLMNGRAPEEVKEKLVNLQVKGNIKGAQPSKRGAWALANSIETAADAGPFEYLYFVGCKTSFSKDSQGTALALKGILAKAGISIAVLGNEEKCCGEYAFRSGDELLFQKLAIENMKNFKKYNVTKIITTCPHGYNILKKEYPALVNNLPDEIRSEINSSFKVYSHLEIIDDLLHDKKIELNENSISAVYHDPCMAGRYNGFYKTPRRVLESVPGLELFEMKRSGSNSFCCGSFGRKKCGDENSMSFFRVNEARSTGAETIVSSCPHCLDGFGHAIDTISDQNIRRADVAEIIFESMKNELKH